MAPTKYDGDWVEWSKHVLINLEEINKVQNVILDRLNKSELEFDRIKSKVISELGDGKDSKGNLVRMVDKVIKEESDQDKRITKLEYWRSTLIVVSGFLAVWSFNIIDLVLGYFKK